MVTITEPALLIRISRLYQPGMSPEELYEATRGVWKLGHGKGAAEYALSVANGIVQEVYAVGAWHEAGSTPYTTRPMSQVAVPGRWEFTGAMAAAEIREKYVGQSVAHYFERGNVNPVNYVNIKRR